MDFKELHEFFKFCANLLIGKNFFNHCGQCKCILNDKKNNRFFENEEFLSKCARKIPGIHQAFGCVDILVVAIMLLFSGETGGNVGVQILCKSKCFQKFKALSVKCKRKKLPKNCFPNTQRTENECKDGSIIQLTVWSIHLFYFQMKPSKAKQSPLICVVCTAFQASFS